MVNFIICEDNFSMASMVKGIISDYTSLLKMDCQIFLYENHFDRVIEFAQANVGQTNVYFLDIVLNENNATGLTLAKQIRKIDVLAYFVFISYHPEFSLKIFQYQLKALDYIYKQDDNIEKRICDCIDTIAYESIQIYNFNATHQITLKNANSFYSVKLNDIVYIETRPGSRTLYCVLKDKTVIEFYDTLKGVLKHLDSRFYHCHRSYIVNTQQIKKLENGNQSYSVTMSDGKICDVSKVRWKELVNRVKS